MAKICEEREENEVGRRKGRPDLKMIGEEEEKRRRGEKEVGWCQKVKVAARLSHGALNWAAPLVQVSRGA